MLTVVALKAGAFDKSHDLFSAELKSLGELILLLFRRSSIRLFIIAFFRAL